MAAEYEVNIKLNTSKVKAGLNEVETAINKTAKKSADIADKRSAAMVRLRNLGDQVTALEQKGINLSKSRYQLKKASEAIDKKNFLTVNERLKLVRNEITAQKNITKELERQEKTRRRQLDANKRARGKKFTDIATGFGFPLLFGGGPTQALAGGIGGAFGGLGGSIAATAIVSQFEALAKRVTEAGQALNSTTTAFEYMSENALFSTKEVEEQAAALKSQGKATELAALLTEELSSKIGNNGVEAMRLLGQETDETQRLWGELKLQLSLLIAGPLKDFLSLVNNFLGGITTVQRYKALLKDLNAEDQKRIQALEDQLTGQQRRKDGTAFLGPEKVLNAEMAAKLIPEVLKLQPEPTAGQRIPVTAKDLRTLTGPKDRSGQRAAQEEERLRQRLAALELERQKIIEVSRFKDKIAAAEAASDSQLVIRLQGEQRKAEIESKRLKDLVKVTDQREIDLINITAATKQLAETREIERQLAEDQRKKKEFFDETVQGLEHQLKLVQATSEAERDRLRIEEKLRKLREGGMPEEQVSQIGGLMRQISEENSPLNRFIKQSTESLNDLESHAVRISEGIGNAIGNSLVNGMQNLVTGAQSVKEVFADMLKSIADVLAQQAAQMIATYIAIGIARAFAGMGSSEENIATNKRLHVGGFEARTPGLFAEGGFVDRPTNALIGEGGEPEYVIPESKMRESMARYSRGSRGASVIPGGDGDATTGEGGIAVAAPIDVRYTVERINSVDYVTADQFQRGMQSAATQGAKQGEQNTLKRLQMSSSTRKRLGM